MEDFNEKDLINFKEMYLVKKRERLVDKVISEIVGKEILTNDPRLIKLITKWKKEANKSDEPSEANDNYLEDPEKIKELKETL
jgi:hypothetical protein